MNKEQINREAREKKVEKLWKGEETRDPKEFIEDFVNDEYFLKGVKRGGRQGGMIGLEEYTKRVKARAKEEISDEEIKKYFLDTEQTKWLLLYFAKYKKMLIYDSDKYPQKINLRYQKYKKQVENMDNFQGSPEWARLDAYGRQVRIKEMDTKRQFYHMQLSELLGETVFQSERVGRTVARLWLISEGLDTFERYERDEEQRRKRMGEF